MNTTQNRPYAVYIVEEREGAKAFWTKVGSAVAEAQPTSADRPNFPCPAAQDVPRCA